MTQPAEHAAQEEKGAGEKAAQSAVSRIAVFMLCAAADGDGGAAFAVKAQERDRLCGAVCQIAVGKEHIVSRCGKHAAAHGGAFSHIARGAHKAHARIAGGKAGDFFGAVVGGAVVGKNQLKRLFRESVGKSREQLLRGLFA